MIFSEAAGGRHGMRSLRGRRSRAQLAASGLHPADSRSLRTLRPSFSHVSQRPTSKGTTCHASEEHQHPEASRCPVARLLPPVVKRPWWEELNFTMDPYKVQSDILQGRDIATGTFLMQEQVVVGGLDVARTALVQEGDSLEGSVPPHLERILGSSSIGIARGAAHDRLRAALAPAFTPEAVEAYIPELQELCEAYVSAWLGRGTVQSWDGELKRLTFEVICRLVCGFRLEAGELDQLNRWFTDLMGGLTFPITVDVPFTPFGRAMAARRNITAAIARQAGEIRSELRTGGANVSGGAVRRSVLRRLVEMEMEGGGGSGAAGLSEVELLDNFIGILIAGHDTTASSLSMLFYTLAQHPEVMQRLQAEQEAVMAAHGQALTAGAVRDMPYADAVVRESWRTHPVVPVVGRVAVQDVQLGGYAIPAGQPLAVALNYIVRNDPRWASETGTLSSAAFNPDRFLDPQARRGSGGGPGSGSQLVFGAGKRYCLGAALATAEIKVLLATLLRRCCRYELVGPVSHDVFPFPVARMDARFERV